MSYIPHPETEGFQKYLFSLLAQRRALQTAAVKQKLDSKINEAASNPVMDESMLYNSVSGINIEAERVELQRELLVVLSSNNDSSSSDNLKSQMNAAGDPLAGFSSDAEALLWHFKSRLAALSCERGSLLRHISKLKRAHMQHIASRSLPLSLISAQRDSQLDPTGPVVGTSGTCCCGEELLNAEECCKASIVAEAVLASRITRLQGGPSRKPVVEDDDWLAVLSHVVGVGGGGGSPARRLMDRLELIPWSHHHRYPIYERVSRMPLKRDRDVHDAGLRVPPFPLSSPTQAEEAIEDLIEEFKEEEAAVLRGEVAIPQSLITPRTAAEMASGAQEVGARNQHSLVYVARRMVPLLLERHRKLFPGAEVPSAASLDSNRSREGKSGSSTSSASVFVVDDMTERLQTISPSLEGDLSAPHAAVLASLTTGGSAAKQAGTNPYLGASTPASLSVTAGLHVDPALRAENAFLDVCDEREVFDRIRGLAEEKAERIAYQRKLLRTQSSLSPSSTAMTAQVVTDKTEWAFTDKALESIGYFRFLRAKRNKLKVLHYVNALVSMQLSMLKDELREEEMGTSSRPSAPKPFTCPIIHHRQQGRGLETQGGSDELSGVDSEGEDSEGEDLVSDKESGVLVVGPDGRPRVHKHAIALMREIEEEVLRVATYHMEAYAAQTQGLPPRVKADPEEGQFDLNAILDDAWAFEASFCAARHQLALAYFQAYRHSESWGVAFGPDYGGDLFAGLGEASRSSSWRSGGPPFRPFDATSPAGEAGEAGVEGRWGGVSSNMCLPRLLGARAQLRREIVDLSFRRPGMATEDGYFASRYISSTVSLELEGRLIESLISFVAEEDRRQFAAIHTSSELSKGGVLFPGLPLAAIYGSLLTPHSIDVLQGGSNGGKDSMRYHRGLMREGAVLPSVGSAAAMVPIVIRRIVSNLSELHHLKHYVEVSELRESVLGSCLLELNVLMKEERNRAHASAEKLAKDSRFVDSMGKPQGDEATLAAFSLLCPSRAISDSPAIVLTTAVELNISPRNAVKAALMRENMIRDLYQSEALSLVHVVQSRALGKRYQAQEMEGIDFDSIDHQGQPRKPEVLKDFSAPCEPFDIQPPGTTLPQSPAIVDTESQVMVAVGAGGTAIGAIWRAPPLAIAELSTKLSESIQLHSVEGLRASLSSSYPALSVAARMQRLRVTSLLLAIRHNQVLLDFIVRKMDRRRRVLTWRLAAMEGAGASRDARLTDVVLGGPPSSYSPSAPLSRIHPPFAFNNGQAGDKGDRPTLSEPPPTKQLSHQIRKNISRIDRHHSIDPELDEGGKGVKAMDTKGPKGGPGGDESSHAHAHPHLDNYSMNELKASRRKLTLIASELFLDVAAIKLRLRSRARMEYIEILNDPLMLKGESDYVIKPLLTVTQDYVAGFIESLQPYACRLDLATCVRELAVLILGSTGGLGHDWGLKSGPDGRKIIQKPEPAPLFQGLDGACRLEKMLLEFGPMWQSIDFEAADKSGDPDPMSWTASPAAVPPGFMFPDLNGMARLDLLWNVPTQWDALSCTSYGKKLREKLLDGAGEGGTVDHQSPVKPGSLPQLDDDARCLELMEGGVKLGRLLIKILNSIIFEAALLAPSSDLARGMDLTRGHATVTSAGKAPKIASHALSHTSLDLYEQVEQRMKSAGLPFLPGALMVPSLTLLHGRMSFIIADGLEAAGKNVMSAGGGAGGRVGVIPIEEARKFLSREFEILSLTHLVAVTRVRDAFSTRALSSSTSSAVASPWSLSGSLEQALAVSLSSPSLSLMTSPGSYCLRFKDADRLTLANEISRIQLMLDRALHQCIVSTASSTALGGVASPNTRPVRAQAISLSILQSIWVHDRMRDTLGMRALIMERPDLLPLTKNSAQISETLFQRSYHGGSRPLPLSPFPSVLGGPPPSSIHSYLTQHYRSEVEGRAAELLQAAEVAAAQRDKAKGKRGDDEDEGEIMRGSKRNGQGEGGGGGCETGVTSLIGLIAWPSTEARSVEASIVVMKQLMDMQAVQVALLRLDKDCQVRTVSEQLITLYSAPSF